METFIPNFVSYEMLLQAVCCRAVAGRSTEEVQYLVTLAEDLCKLMREVDEMTRRRR